MEGGGKQRAKGGGREMSEERGGREGGSDLFRGGT